MKPSEVLAKAADLIRPEGAWTQRAYSRDVFGAHDGPALLPDATCWCATGAIAAVQGARWPSVEDVGRAELRDFLRSTTIVAFNDAPGRTQAEVVAALRAASAKAAEAGQ